MVQYAEHEPVPMAAVSSETVHQRDEQRNRRQVLGRIAGALYARPRRFGLRDQDEVGEVLCRYSARIDAAIKRYRDVGSDFEAYVASCVRYMGLSMRRDQARQYDREETFGEFALDAYRCRQHDEVFAQETAVCGNDDSYTLGSAFGINPDTAKLRLMVLCLKHAWILNDDDIAHAAAAAALNMEDISSKIALARELTQEQYERLTKRREVREASWMRIQVLERRIRREPDDARRRTLGERLSRERALYARKHDAVKTTRILVPNSIIAEVLSVPKGTVDAALFFLRKRAERGLSATVKR